MLLFWAYVCYVVLLFGTVASLRLLRRCVFIDVCVLIVLCIVARYYLLFVLLFDLLPFVFVLLFACYVVWWWYVGVVGFFDFRVAILFGRGFDE